MNAIEIAALVGALGLIILALAAWRIGSQMRIANMLRAGEFKTTSINGVTITPKVEWARAQLEAANRKLRVRP